MDSTKKNSRYLLCNRLIWNTKRYLGVKRTEFESIGRQDQFQRLLKDFTSHKQKKANRPIVRKDSSAQTEPVEEKREEVNTEQQFREIEEEAYEIQERCRELIKKCSIVEEFKILSLVGKNVYNEANDNEKTFRVRLDKRRESLSEFRKQIRKVTTNTHDSVERKIERSDSPLLDPMDPK